jgi:hypothetical protein
MVRAGSSTATISRTSGVWGISTGRRNDFPAAFCTSWFLRATWRLCKTRVCSADHNAKGVCLHIVLSVVLHVLEYFNEYH